MNRSTAALVSVAAVALAGAIGASHGPQKPREAIWYAALRKPSFTPPGPAIGITWGVLETLLCVTGYRLLTRPASAARSIALAGWSSTLCGLAGFQTVFFGRKQLGTSAGVATAMLASTTTAVAAAAQTDPVSSVAMAPLVLWTAFAALLSEEVWRWN